MGGCDGARACDTGLTQPPHFRLLERCNDLLNRKRLFVTMSLVSPCWAGLSFQVARFLELRSHAAT